jgi:hypothetical protein
MWLAVQRMRQVVMGGHLKRPPVVQANCDFKGVGWCNWEEKQGGALRVDLLQPVATLTWDVKRWDCTPLRAARRPAGSPAAHPGDLIEARPKPLKNQSGIPLFCIHLARPEYYSTWKRSLQNLAQNTSFVLFDLFLTSSLYQNSPR